MRVNLDKYERKQLKNFFIKNLDWLKARDFSNENNLIELVNKYGKYLEENNLNCSRNLLMLLVELKEELTRIKIKPPTIKERSIRNFKSKSINMTSESLIKWQNYFYEELPQQPEEKQSTSIDLDAISDMLAKKIQHREEQQIKQKSL